MRRAALALLTAGFVVTLLVAPWSDAPYTDLPIYRADAHAMLDGALPYRDFGFEYPPLAAPLLALPGLVGTGEQEYRLAFAALALALGAAVVLLTGALAERTDGDRRVALIVAACAPLLMGALIRSRFDLAPVALTLAALLLLCKGRPRLGFAVLGAGAMTKGFPLVVAPVALAWLVARGERRGAAQSAAVLAATVAAVCGLAVAVSPHGARGAVSYHLDRPVQIESTPATAVLTLNALGLGEARTEESYRSMGVRHPAAGAAAALFTVLLAGAVAILTAGAAAGGQEPPGPRALVIASLGAVTAFAAFGKVLSPQFLIWVVPLAALAFAWRMYALAAAATAAIVLTSVEFPALYAQVVQLDPWVLALVAARNAILIGVVVLAVRALAARRARAPAAARSPWPARPRRPRPAPR